MGTVERRAREKDELRRRILEAATALFLEQGYESVSMRKIADRLARWAELRKQAAAERGPSA